MCLVDNLVVPLPFYPEQSWFFTFLGTGEQLVAVNFSWRFKLKQQQHMHVHVEILLKFLPTSQECELLFGQQVQVI